MSTNMDISMAILEELRGLKNQINTYGTRFDDIEMKIAAIQEILTSISAVQRVEDEIIRKSANSINLIIRIVSGLMSMSAEQLGKLLVESSALRETVRPTMDWSFDLVPTNGYPPLHGLELLVAELNTIISSLKNKSSVNKNHIIPINTPMNSTLAQPTVSCSTLQNPELSQKANSKILPNLTTGTSSVPKTITPVNNKTVPSNKSKEEEALRRKYKNKYRYLDKAKTLLSDPTLPPVDQSIPIPYQHPIYRGKKYVCIKNVLSGESVVRPLSCVQPRIVLKESDHKNLAAVLPTQRSVIEKCRKGYLPCLSMDFPNLNQTRIKLESNCNNDIAKEHNSNESNTKKPNCKNTSSKNKMNTKTMNIKKTKFLNPRCGKNRIVTRASSGSSPKKREASKKETAVKKRKIKYEI